MRTFNVIFLALALVLASCSKVGKAVSEFNFTTLQGVNLNSSELKGKVIVFNVWATWCGTCIAERPVLNKIYSEYQNKDVVFIALSDESRSTVSTSLERFPFAFHQVVDAGKYTDKLQSRMAKTYPQHIIVNRQGEVIYDHSDANKILYDELKEAIEAGLKS